MAAVVGESTQDRYDTQTKELADVLSVEELTLMRVALQTSFSEQLVKTDLVEKHRTLLAQSLSDFVPARPLCSYAIKVNTKRNFRTVWFINNHWTENSRLRVSTTSKTTNIENLDTLQRVSAKVQSKTPMYEFKMPWLTIMDLASVQVSSVDESSVFYTTLSDSENIVRLRESHDVFRWLSAHLDLYEEDYQDLADKFREVLKILKFEIQIDPRKKQVTSFKISNSTKVQLSEQFMSHFDLNDFTYWMNFNTKHDDLFLQQVLVEVSGSGPWGTRIVEKRLYTYTDYECAAPLEYFDVR